MSAILWSKVPSGTYERMVAVLLSTLHRDAERIDGTGGDGGRDVQLRTEARLDIFELKSHSERIGKSQRQQIVRSLRKATKLSPASWTLVVPVDHNPSELDWFDGLRKQYPFPLTWRGLTWLDMHMAEHPCIPRYFLYGGSDEAVEILRDLRRDEKEFADGIDHVINRVEGWIAKLRDLDPFWAFQIGRDDHGRYTITPVPKYRGAERDRPISIHIRSEFPDTEEGTKALAELQAAIEYGRPTTVSKEYIKVLEVDAPTGVGGTFTEGISIAPSEPTSFQADLTILVVDPNGRHLTSLPIRFDERTAGMVGAELTGTDPSGALRIRLRASPTQQKFAADVHYRLPDGALPSQAVPVLRFLNRMTAPNTAVFRFAGSDLAKSVEMSFDRRVDDGFLRIIEELAYVQTQTGVYFAIPDEITRDDVAATYFAASLLRGKTIPFTWSQSRVKLRIRDPQPIAQIIVNGIVGAIRTVNLDHREVVCGHDIPLGQCEFLLVSARIGNQDELEARLPLQPEEEVQAVFVPNGTDNGEMRLIEPTA